MSLDESAQLLAYEAKLRREEMEWQAQLETVRHSDQAAVDIGIGALKTFVLINAGALVSLLAVGGQLWEKNSVFVSNMFKAGLPFIWGLAFSSAGFAVAYVYQSIVTLLAQQIHIDMSQPASQSAQKFRSTLSRLSLGLSLLMLTLSIGGLACFVCGAKAVFFAFLPE